MDAKPLFTEDKTDVVAYFCSVCRVVKESEAKASSCCQPDFCGCGELRKGGYCEACSVRLTKESLEMTKKEVRAAEVIEQPSTEFVFSESTTENDGYFKLCDIESVYEGQELPLFVYDCSIEKWAGLDAEEIVGSALECDWFEDAVESVDDLKELEDFLAKWNSKQTLEQHNCNLGKIIILNPDAFNAWLLEK